MLSSKPISCSEVDSGGEKSKGKSSAIAGTAMHEVTAISVPGVNYQKRNGRHH